MAIVGHLWYSTPAATFLLDVNDLGAIVSGQPGKLAKVVWREALRFPDDGIPADDHGTYAVWMSAVPDADA